MNQPDLSATIENYLGILFVLERDNEPIVGARIAELLGVTPPTVTNTLKRMQRDGLVSSDDGNHIHLTTIGNTAARSVMRRHMLSEWMLVKVLSWSKLHGQAHQLEHGISDEVEAALLKELGDPELCPHGNPFPGYESSVSSWIPLTEIQKGTKVIIRRVHELAEEMPELLSFLEVNGIVLGKPTEVIDSLKFNQTVTLKVDECLVTLGFQTAKYIYVEVVPGPALV